MTLPTIDAHFWIVRDGEIIDRNFKEYDFIRNIHGCEPETMVYLPAPHKTQELMIAIFKKETSKVFKSHKWETVMKEILFITKLAGIDQPVFNRCWQNCIIEQYYNGGEIVFGSMGFKKHDGSYWYEYGGENYKTVKDFLVKERLPLK